MVQMLWEELDPDEDGIFRKRDFLALSNRVCDQLIEDFKKEFHERLKKWE